MIPISWGALSAAEIELRKSSPPRLAPFFKMMILYVGTDIEMIQNFLGRFSTYAQPNRTSAEKQAKITRSHPLYAPLPED